MACRKSRSARLRGVEDIAYSAEVRHYRPIRRRHLPSDRPCLIRRHHRSLVRSPCLMRIRRRVTPPALTPLVCRRSNARFAAISTTMFVFIIAAISFDINRLLPRHNARFTRGGGYVAAFINAP